jgi:TatD DNase family protein
MTMQVIDTHAHLDEKHFVDNLPDVLDRAYEFGVVQQICIATSLRSSRNCTLLAFGHPSVYASVGIHPNKANRATPTDWAEVVTMASMDKVVALGETGLDRQYEFTPFEMQQDYFSRHIALSRKTELPLVIHCRGAETDLLPMLVADYKKHGPLRGVMHSFAGDQALAKACIDLGLYLSFAGMLTFKTGEDLREVAAQLPAERILVETDSPYLIPDPLRGQVKHNEPAYIMYTVHALAQARGVPMEEMARQTTENARRLFNLPLPLVTETEVPERDDTPVSV